MSTGVAVILVLTVAVVVCCVRRRRNRVIEADEALALQPINGDVQQYNAADEI